MLQQTDEDNTDFKDSAIDSDEEGKITEDVVQKIEKVNAKTK